MEQFHHFSFIYACEFRRSGPKKFSAKSLIFEVRKQPLYKRSLGKAKTEQCIITCGFVLDVGAGNPAECTSIPSDKLNCAHSVIQYYSFFHQPSQDGVRSIGKILNWG
jgi:hypothetical protein